MMKALIGKQHNLPPELKAKIEASPMKMDKYNMSKNLKNKTEYDPRVETREEVMKANALEDKNNDAAAKRAYDKMMAKKAKSEAKAKDTPMKKGADPASVTNRRNEGDKKGARIEKRRGKAAARGNTGKSKRLSRKLAKHDATDNRGKQPTRTKSVGRGGSIEF